MTEFLFNFVGFTLLGAVAIVLFMGIYTLFKGGSASKKYSNNAITNGSPYPISLRALINQLCTASKPR